MSDLDRIYDLLTAGTGVIRTRNADLEREAAERAFEARQQVGLNTTGTDADKIIHPPQAEREARAGEGWAGKGIAEVATWSYLWSDPIAALVDYTSPSTGNKAGLLNSEPHNTILRDPSFVYWGAGLYDELPPGDPEEARRYYLIVWLSKQIPTVKPRFSDVPRTHNRYADIEWAAVEGIATGYSDGTFKPDQPVTRGELMAFLRRTVT
jgi:hypothetical protein